MADRGLRERFFDAGSILSGDFSGVQRRREIRDIDERERSAARQQRRRELPIERRRAAAEDFRNIRELAAGGFTDRAISTINKRLQVGRLLPDFDSATTDFVKDLLVSGDTQRAIEFLDVADQAAVTGGFIPPRQQAEQFTLSPGQQRFAAGDADPIAENIEEDGAGPEGLFSARTRFFDNGTSIQSDPQGGIIVTAPDGRLVPPGQERVDILRAAREEEIAFAQARSGATARGSGSERRIQNSIDEGIDSAQGAAILRRSIELLDKVRTGGFAAAAISAKQLFGIESADEGELSSGLGKAVLSQLRATFGAAFTEREGARLEGIEARMGANPATNIRLLNQTLSIIERAAKRGINAALEIEDFRTAADIQDLLDFRLTDEGGIDTGADTGTLSVEEQAELTALEDELVRRR